MKVKLILALAGVALMAAADAKGLIGFKFEADHTDCLYRLGEDAVVTITATNGAGEAVRTGSVRVEWDNYGRRNLGVVKEWNFAEKNPLVVKGALDKPGFMRVRVQGKDSEGAWIGCQWGVGFEPEKIRPASERPADFDAFWEGASARFAKEVPIDAKMEKDEQTGMAPEAAARTIVKVALQKGRVKPYYAIGFSYKLLVLLDSLLPCRTVRWLLFLLYGK